MSFPSCFGIDRKQYTPRPLSDNITVCFLFCTCNYCSSNTRVESISKTAVALCVLFNIALGGNSAVLLNLTLLETSQTS